MLSARRLASLGAAGLALLVPIVALAGAGSPAAQPPSFERDVAPLLRDKCAGCHRLGGIAPFSLEDAREAKRRAPAIAAAVEARLMPPWPPGPKSPPYARQDERTLSSGQRETILRWVRTGARIDGRALKARPAAGPQARPGESVLTLRLPKPYRPAARGNDDYRCFLLDPGLAQDAFVTSAQIRPGSARVVHHVILFRVDPERVAEAERLDAAERGQGWTCFGGTGIGNGADVLTDAGWIAAWAPGSAGVRFPEGVGVKLAAGSRIVMQVHYNLLNGRAADRSSAVLTTAPASGGLTPAATMLLPGPVELACGKRERGPLCDRDAAIADLVRTYGPSAAFAPAGLLAICGGQPAAPRASAVSTCDRIVTRPTTIHAVAGHMHLLGASIRLELNPGTPEAQVLLDIPRWDFHWQSAYAFEQPVETRAGDVLRVTCRHDVRKRGTDGSPKTPRYVVWGEGTADEMCLGVLQVTRG